MKRTCLLLFLLAAAGLPASAVPVLYTTHFFHPHSDPDDHYDMMTLFAMPAFDIRGIVLDRGEKGVGREGVWPLMQAMHLTGREVPYAAGLIANLQSPEDTARTRHPLEQGGIALILKTLRTAEEPVTVFVTGSLRDVAAAYNREPQLFEEKVGRLYVNAGSTHDQVEWNVGLDLHAYLRIMRSGLPVYWAPCFGKDGYQTYWKFTQGEVFEALSPPMKSFFLYMLGKLPLRQVDPIAYLGHTPGPALLAEFAPKERNMWCTGPFLHAAGRETRTCGFEAIPVTFLDNGLVRIGGGEQARPVKTFHVRRPKQYPDEMRAALVELLQGVQQGGSG